MNTHNIKSAEEQLPRLYSKRLITTFSLLFSTIFGAVILMSNLKQAGENKARLHVLFFGILYTLAAGYTITVLQVQGFFAIFANFIGSMVLNEYFWNSYLGKELEYEKKSWRKPALISAAICIPFVLLALAGF